MTLLIFFENSLVWKKQQKKDLVHKVLINPVQTAIIRPRDEKIKQITCGVACVTGKGLTCV